MACCCCVVDCLSPATTCRCVHALPDAFGDLMFALCFLRRKPRLAAAVRCMTRLVLWLLSCPDGTLAMGGRYGGSLQRAQHCRGAHMVRRARPYCGWQVHTRLWHAMLALPFPVV